MMAKLRWAAVLCAGMTLVCSALSAQPRQQGPEGDERILFDAANRERLDRHLPALHWDGRLARAARDHAALMSRWGALSHQFTGEPGLSARFSRAGVRFTFAAENVGIASSASELHSLWMNSRPHRENLLEKRVNSIGISVVRRGVHLYAVEDFAGRPAALSLDEQEREVGALLAAHGLLLRETTPGDRETCSLSRGVAPGAHPRYLVRYLTAAIDQLPPELLEEMTRGIYHSASVGACETSGEQGFSGYRLAILLY